MTGQDQLSDLLLLHVSRIVPHQWPGTDGLTQQNVLHEYPALAARGLVPGEDVLRREHPELTEELARFFSTPSRQRHPGTGGLAPNENTG